MSTPDPDTRKEQLLYRALADFSDACDIPTLNPSCPFFQSLPDGTPVCGEECKDILGDELAPAAQLHTLTLGDDLAAVRGSSRPRPRRPRPDGAIAFDARQVYLSERERDVSSWGMTSLISGLRYQFAWMTHDEVDEPDLARATSIAAELNRRGVDPDSVIRQGLFRHITSSIIWHLRNALSKGADDLGWVELLSRVSSDFTDLGKDCSDTNLERAVDALFPYLTAWVVFAPLEDLLAHRIDLDSAAELRAKADQLPDRNYDSIWLVERFTTTYLDGWSMKSLRREWRYIHSQCPGPCPPANMRERQVPIDDVALRLAEIGARHIESHDKDPNDESGRLLNVDQFFPLAVEALDRGDRAEAVSIYRMLAKVRPEDRQVANNLGFCILPEEPHEAAIYFETSIRYSTPGLLLGMTYLNLALARHQLGDPAGAREAIEVARENPLDSFSGYMWNLDEWAKGTWTITRYDIADLRSYADELETLIDATPR